MRCASCGFENPEGMKFCGECATPLKRWCPQCGVENPPGFKFCGECATPLTERPAIAQSSPVAVSSTPAHYTPKHLAERIRAEQAAMAARGITDGERKTITALFADLKGSTALIEGLDPEDARSIIDPALQLMMDAVHRYDGYVAQALGDGIFALFGAPIAHEDHPQRALYAALRMQDEMRRYADRLREKGRAPLLMRVGVNTDEVVVRSIRKDDLHTDYVPVGHSTNLAARMEQLAAPGSILVTEQTHTLTAGYFEFKALGKTQVKGVEEPLNVYEAVGAGPLRTRLQVAAQRGLTRFVGRLGEMEHVRRALEQAKAGHGQIVGVMGEPGVGKSRLFYEFKLTAPSGCLILEAFSVSYGKASPYLPVIELLKNYFQIHPQDDERSRRERVIGKVLGLDRSLEDTLPYFFALLGVEDLASALQHMDPQIRRRRTFEAVKKLFLRESLNQPLILIFEDLHWIDTETQGFLDTLSESVASARILLFVNYRPEYRPEWGQKTYYTQLHLAPLGREEAQELLTFLLGNNATLKRLKQLILEKTQGTPFFMEEVVQTLAEERVLVGEKGNYRVAKAPTELHISPTVQGVLAARIDRLAVAEKEFLQQVAVMGREFSLSLLRQVIPQPEEELYRLLASLQNKEFLYEQPAFPEVEYIFKHALTQEVAYTSLLQERRKSLHERTAQAIEMLFHSKLDDHYSELAHHYSRSGNTEKAIKYLQRAGQQAVQRSANAEAVNHLTAALELLKTLPDVPERTQQEITLHLMLGVPLTATKGYGAPEMGHVYARALELCRQVGDTPQLGFLVSLKTFQRLGYFVPLSTVPLSIVAHVARCAGIFAAMVDLGGYDDSGSRRRHLQVIREYLRVRPYGRSARHVIVQVMEEAARTKDDLADLINVALEELVRQQWELPAFSTLQRAARHVRALVARHYYRLIAQALSSETLEQINGLLKTERLTRRSAWNELKQGPGSATLSHFRTLVMRYRWLAEQSAGVRAAVGNLPPVKVKQFAAEARTLDAARMQALTPHKRAALAVALLVVQSARALDDLAEMFIKRMTRVHQRGKDALAQYREQHQDHTDRLIDTLREMVTAYQMEGTEGQRLAAIGDVLGDQSEEVLQQCEAHQAYAGNNYYPFLWRFYMSHRATLFRLLRVLPLESTSQDTSLIEALSFLLHHEHDRGEWLRLTNTGLPENGTAAKNEALDLSWVSEKWWRLVTGESFAERHPHRLNRRHFEICVFSQLMWELKSGDVCIVGSDKYADYRQQLISWEEYDRMVAEYGEQVGLPVEGTTFVAHTRQWLETIAMATDTAFPQNTSVRIEHGEPIISRSVRRTDPQQVPLLEKLLAARIEPVNILDVLADTEQWLHWTRFFGPLSGHDAKVAEPRERYVLTTFCYGCNLGPSQAARALQTIDRRQLAWINQRHISEDKLDQVITALVNAYNRFELPRYWGSGKHASADGTKWDLYEQNLLSEYHIRYGGYGGIGYYHVSDTYVALFSHFIPCGVWEAVYILDGLLLNQSDIQPDTVHADTQGQSAPVFGLSYLLGIKLMPRIRNWKDLKFFRPSLTARYLHLDELFAEPIDWELIQTHLADMLRVVLSIKVGRITASTILRKLGTASRKNRLYFAFRELGRAIRTAFLLQYLGEEELRATIHAATNKSEAFNNFIKWLFFGGMGTIAENDRDEQRKLIKYSHVVANCLIFHNVQAQTRLLHQLIQEGYDFASEAIARLSPYLTEHVNRFGAYTLNLNRDLPLPDYRFSLFS